MSFKICFLRHSILFFQRCVYDILLLCIQLNTWNSHEIFNFLWWNIIILIITAKWYLIRVNFRSQIIRKWITFFSTIYFYVLVSSSNKINWFMLEEFICGMLSLFFDKMRCFYWLNMETLWRFYKRFLFSSKNQ